MNNVEPHTIIPDSLYEDKNLSLLGINIVAHIKRREQGQYGACTENAKNMAERFHVSLNSIKREIEKLSHDGYISKEIVRGIGWKLNILSKVVGEPTQGRPTQSRPTQGSESTHTGFGVNPHRVGGEPTQGHKETKEETREETKKNKGDKSPRGKKAPPFSPFSSLPDGELKAALLEYAEVRKGGKSPIKTKRQESLLLNKLGKLAGNDTKKQIQIIENATMGGWSSFYPLKDEKGQEMPKPPGGNDTWRGTRFV